MAYANELAEGDSERSITQLEEGHEEELWSEMMGDDEYANANVSWGSLHPCTISL